MQPRPIIRILLLFLCAYFGALVLASIVFRVVWPSALAVLCIFAFYLSISCGLFIGSEIRPQNPPRVELSQRSSYADLLFDTLLVLACASVVYAWTLLLDHYGGALAMIVNAFDIRESTIGAQDSIVPTPVSYATSTVYAIWVFELARGEISGSMRKLRLALAFVIIVLIDLMTFGRVGTLFALVSTVAWYFSRKRKVRVRTVLLIIGILAISTVPRLVRGDFDNFEGSLDRYRPAMRVQTPEMLNFAIAILPYYAGGFFSAGQLIERVDIDSKLDGGTHTFTPVANAYNRFFSIPRITSIDDSVEVPFEHNVHGLPWDVMRDFGVYGFFPAAFLLGLLLGIISNDNRTRFGLASIYFVGSIVIFFPVYSLLSFGSFFISLWLLLVLRMLKWNCQ